MPNDQLALLAAWRAADRVACPVCGALPGQPCIRVTRESGIYQTARGPVHRSTGRISVKHEPHAKRVTLGGAS